MTQTIKRVLLWGSYDEGNFGDDLMAVLLATYLRSQNVEPLVLGLKAKALGSHAITVTHNLKAGLESVDICLIGGGEFLFRESLLRRILRSHPRKFERQCDQLSRTCALLDKKIYSISIGGDGVVDPKLISRSRRDLFDPSVYCGGTVRLKTDVAILNRCGADVCYYPDILLGTPDFISASVGGPKNRKFKVGINLHKKHYKSVREVLIKIKERHENIEITFLLSHLIDAGYDYEVDGDEAMDGANLSRYEDVYQFSRALSELDLVVSSKLHVGVVSAAYGAEFVSYGGKAKAKLFVDDMQNNCGVKNVARFIALENVNAFSDAVESGYQKWNQSPSLKSIRFNEMEKARIGSRGHFEFLRKLIGN